MEQELHREGRKRGKVMKTHSIAFSDEIYEYVRYLAYKDHDSVSAIVRKACLRLAEAEGIRKSPEY